MLIVLQIEHTELEF